MPDTNNNLKKKKLKGNAKALVESLEIHLDACKKLDIGTQVHGIIAILAGSQALHPDIHAEFAAANHVTPLSVIRKNARRTKKLEEE